MRQTAGWFRLRRLGPARPRPLRSTTTTTTAALSWDAVSGGFYTVQRSLDGMTWVTRYQGTGVTFTDTGLTAATTYLYRHNVTVAEETSLYSDSATVTTQTTAQPPATPEAPTASGMTDTTIPLSWVAVAGATSYTLQRALTATGTFTTIYTGADLAFTDTGRTPDTAYYYRLAAANADGMSGWSETTTARTTVTTQPPPAHAAPTASGISSDSLTLLWGAVTGATFYVAQQSTDEVTWERIYRGADTSVPVTGLTSSTRYYFRVRSGNAAGVSAFSPVASFTTTTQRTSTVTPVTARYIRERSGVCVHPNFNADLSVWKMENASEICALVAAQGMTFIRGQLPNTNTIADAWASACRENGLKWLMLVVTEGSSGLPTDMTPTQVRAKIARIRDRYADVCLGIEGMNEPNHNRGGADAPPVVDDWATNQDYGAVPMQRLIWNAARDPVNGEPNPLRDVLIVGPSLHDTAAQNSYDGTIEPGTGGARHYHQLSENGLLDANGDLQYCQMVGLHSYPGGGVPITATDRRLGYLYDAFGDLAPVFFSEWGYVNALNVPEGGFKPISEAGAGTYGPRGFLQLITHVKPNGVQRGEIYLTYFEELDDYGPNYDEVQDHFGMVAVDQTNGEAGATNPANWRRKPVSRKIGRLLSALAEPASTPAYEPVAVVCAVSSSVTDAALQFQVTQTKAQADDGTGTCWVWRDKSVWNRDTREEITVLPVNISVRDRVGTRSSSVAEDNIPQVDAEVYSIDLR